MARIVNKKNSCLARLFGMEAEMGKDMLKKGINLAVGLIFAFSTIAQAAPIRQDTLRPVSTEAGAGDKTAEALVARLSEAKLISEKEHRGKDGDSGINMIAKIAILARRARDLKQGISKGLSQPIMHRAGIMIDHDVPLIRDVFFENEVLPLIREKVKGLKELKKLPSLKSKKVSIEKVWSEWTVRAIPGWRKSCREDNIADDIFEHYGRTRTLTLIDYNDYRYLKSLRKKGAGLIADLLFHGFVHAVVAWQGTADMTAGQIEDYVLEIAPIDNVKRLLHNTKAIDKYNEEQDILEQGKRLRNIRKILKNIEQAMRKRYRRNRYFTILKNLRAVSQELNYMNVYPENEKEFRNRLEYRHELTSALSEAVLKHNAALNHLRITTDEDLRRYVDYAIATGITSEENGERSLELTRRNIEAWFSPENHIPRYILQGLVRGMLEGRSEDIIYDYAGSIESEGWKEFGTAGIRNEAVQSAFDIIRNLELEEFAKTENDPRLPILTGPHLINSISLIKQAMTIIRLVDFIKYKIETGEWPEEVSEKECGGWPKEFSEEFKEDIKRKTITIAYDSRLNGRYFAYLLAAVFLKNGFKVNIFDNPAGVPGGVIVACGADFFGKLVEGYDFNSIEGSVFGVLVSASHSEAWFNGFKVFLGHLKSQVDASMKQMLKDTMMKIGYEDMPLEELASKSKEELGAVLKANKDRLTWVGGDERMEDFDYCGGTFVPFYRLYYEYLSKRSPIAHINGEDLRRVIEVRRALKVLYTAFFGVGAKKAANLPGFFNNMGYKNVDVVNKQTDEMDGRFPGHLMPDPGVPEGWMSNLWNYIEQNAGGDFSDIKKVIEALNQIEVGVATDPDIDRTAIMLDLPKGAIGNIKKIFKKWVEVHINANFGKRAEAIRAKVLPALERLEDKLLLTANDAWTFMAYYKLKIMEESGQLTRNKLYIILKSHLTTTGLNRVARYFRDKGYNVEVVDTYVGFTEIGKKARDLFDVAKAAWELRGAIKKGAGLGFSLNNLRNKYRIVKEHVPYETAGVKMIEEAIEEVSKYEANQSEGLKAECLKKLYIIAHMELLMGVEESNGYSELGYYNPEENNLENAHISDKDGSLAAYEFLELLSYGAALLDKSGYQMYTDMLKELDWVATNNQFLLYPGFQGKEQKANSISAIEKIMAMIAQKMLDNEKGVKLSGKYPVTGVTIYRDEKYDSIYPGFPEEGVRFNLISPSGKKGSVAYRPSGTGNNNRSYAWIEAERPGEEEGIEDYRNRVNEELITMVRIFFGEPADTEGRHKPTKEYPRFLVALKEVIGSEEKVMELIRKTLGIDEIFTAEEEKLYKAVAGYIKWPTLRGAILENVKAWDRYLSADEAKNYPRMVNFYINDKRIQIPNAIAKAWQASLVGYLSELVKYEGLARVNVACDDLQIAEYVAKRTTDVQVEIVPIPKEWTRYMKYVRPEETIKAIIEILAKIRPDIPMDRIEDIIRAHTHPKPRVVDEIKRKERLAEQVPLVSDLDEEYRGGEYREKPKRTIFIHTPYEISGEVTDADKILNVTEIMAAVEDIPGALGKEGTSIGKFGGYIIPDAYWSYNIGKIGEKEHIILVFEIEKEKKGGGRFEDLAPIVEHYKSEGARVFVKEKNEAGNVRLKEVTSAIKSSSAGDEQGRLRRALHKTGTQVRKAAGFLGLSRKETPERPQEVPVEKFSFEKFQDRQRRIVVPQLISSMEEIITVTMDKVTKLEREAAHRELNSVEEHALDLHWRDIAKAALILSYFGHEKVEGLVKMVFTTPYSYAKGDALQALANISPKKAVVLAKVWGKEREGEKGLLDACLEAMFKGQADHLMEKPQEELQETDPKLKAILESAGIDPASEIVGKDREDIFRSAELRHISDEVADVLVSVKDRVALPMIRRLIASDYDRDNIRGADLAVSFGDPQLIPQLKKMLESIEAHFAKLVSERGYDLENPHSWGSGTLFRERDAQISLARAILLLGNKDYIIPKLKEWFEFHLRLEKKGRGLLDSDLTRGPIYTIARILIGTGEAGYVVLELRAYYKELEDLGEIVVGYSYVQPVGPIKRYEFWGMSAIASLLLDAKDKNAAALIQKLWERAVKEGGLYAWKILLNEIVRVGLTDAADFLKDKLREWKTEQSSSHELDARDVAKALIGLGEEAGVRYLLDGINKPITEPHKRNYNIYLRFESAQVLIDAFKLYKTKTTEGGDSLTSAKSSSAGKEAGWWDIGLIPQEIYDKAHRLSYEDSRIGKVRQAITNCDAWSVRLDTLANDTGISVEEVYAVMVRINESWGQTYKFMFIGPAEPHPTGIAIPYTRYSSHRFENEEKRRVEKALNKSVERLPLAVDILKAETNLTLAGIADALDSMSGDRSWAPGKFYIDDQNRADYIPKSSSAGELLNLADIKSLSPEALDKAIASATGVLEDVLSHSKVAAEVSRFGEAGTIVINDESIPPSQRDVVFTIYKENSPALKELERLTGCVIRLRSQLNMEDIKGELIIISDTEVSGYEDARYLMINDIPKKTDGYLPIAPLVGIAKALLGLKDKEQINSSLKELYRNLCKKPLTDEIIQQYLNNKRFYIELPKPEAYDYQKLEMLQRQALAALIAA